MTLDDWQSIARELQAALKDDVIEASVKQLPAEIYAVSGREIISKLKSRRGHLEEYATDYYKFIAQQVDIIGSEEQERFAINRGNNETSVNIFRISKDAGTDSKAFYSRTFKNDETNGIWKHSSQVAEGTVCIQAIVSSAIFYFARRVSFFI
jgi:hypothetical protein